MARNQSMLVNWSQYLAARGVLGWMHCFDVDYNLAMAARLGDVAHRLMHSRRRYAEDQVMRAFAGITEGRASEIVHQSFRHMLQVFAVDSIASPRLMSPDGWPHHVRIGNVQPMLDLLVRGEPLILLTGHVGNWELTGSLLGVLGYPIHALARPLDNPLVNRWVFQLRESRGIRIVTKWGATSVLQDAIEAGGHIAFIADQNAGDQGLFVPFFGRLASSYKSIALLAVTRNMPIVAGYARRTGPGFEWEVRLTDIIRPDDWADVADPIFYVTARYTHAIEMMVRESPEQYLWVHRRWKSRPRFERLGRPFPTRLRQKLESLPWMTGERIERIVRSSGD